MNIPPIRIRITHIEVMIIISNRSGNFGGSLLSGRLEITYLYPCKDMVITFSSLNNTLTSSSSFDYIGYEPQLSSPSSLE